MSASRFCSLVLLGALALPHVAAASDHRLELGGSYQRVEPSANDLDDFDVWSVRGTYYFAPVRNAAYPLAEAAFMERASRVSASFSRADPGDDEADLSQISAGFYFDRLLLLASLSYFDNAWGNETDWSAGVGYAPIDGSLISVEYSDADDGNWHLRGKWVYTGWGAQALNLTAHADFMEHYDQYGLGADFYFNRAISVGGAVYYRDYDSGPSDTIHEVRARKFLTPALGGGVSYRTMDSQDAWSIDAVLRF
ncbi:hypothetical protein CAI21_16000 [Alkalilimnicola ehrlichii]|uniref:Uncharacterized protein n=1 Tax=Alkalilimnicola ehrlichii TaxID=351052 RepID=A0A3E0WP06_9GAMM|nr:putative porin [Alkalilimnicola ehrlichii]RFA26787.1 hypothetical protein CAI21_16000 [Alkalilimnicola ehrlichii]RFA33881.1 hypothetical protein CAL65_16125 [Alkalilimnicola ehrlichii]